MTTTDKFMLHRLTFHPIKCLQMDKTVDVWKIHEETEDAKLMEACEKHVPLVLKEKMFRVKNAVKNGVCYAKDSDHFPDVEKKRLITAILRVMSIRVHDCEKAHDRSYDVQISWDELILGVSARHHH